MLCLFSEIKKLEYISKGRYASELYACILGTSSSLYRAEEGQNEYINNLEKFQKKLQKI